MVRHRMSENAAQVNHVEPTFGGDSFEGYLLTDSEAQVNIVAVNRLETQNIFRLPLFFFHFSISPRNLC